MDTAPSATHAADGVARKEAIGDEVVDSMLSFLYDNPIAALLLLNFIDSAGLLNKHKRRYLI
jgi:hypothetical protein